MAKKIFRLDTTKTLRSIAPGEKLLIHVAGKDAETSYTNLQSTRSKLKLNVRLHLTDDNMNVIAIGL